MKCKLGSNRRMILSIIWVVLGAVLVGCNMAGAADDYWCGLGQDGWLIFLLRVV